MGALVTLLSLRHHEQGNAHECKHLTGNLCMNRHEVDYHHCGKHGSRHDAREIVESYIPICRQRDRDRERGENKGERPDLARAFDTASDKATPPIL